MLRSGNNLEPLVGRCDGVEHGLGVFAEPRIISCRENKDRDSQTRASSNGISSAICPRWGESDHRRHGRNNLRRRHERACRTHGGADKDYLARTAAPDKSRRCGHVEVGSRKLYELGSRNRPGRGGALVAEVERQNTKPATGQPARIRKPLANGRASLVSEDNAHGSRSHLDTHESLSIGGLERHYPRSIAAAETLALPRRQWRRLRFGLWPRCTGRIGMEERNAAHHGDQRCQRRRNHNFHR